MADMIYWRASLRTREAERIARGVYDMEFTGVTFGRAGFGLVRVVGARGAERGWRTWMQRMREWADGLTWALRA